MFKSSFVGPVLAILIAVGFIIWMSSGSPEEVEVANEPASAEALISSVQVVVSESRQVAESLEINGVTEAKRFVTVRSEVSGKVVELPKAEGDALGSNELIVRLDLQDIPDRIKQAEAFQEQTRLEYEGTKRLVTQGLQNEAQLAGALASYEQAKAQLAGLKLTLDNTDIRAPFAGQLENFDLELGSFVSMGTAIGDVYDYSQLKFVGAVSEKDIASLKLGQPGRIELINGQLADGSVTYIGSVTNPATRTFTVELTIDDVGRNISGVTSVATVELGDTEGHYISPALLYINDEGEMGVKLLNAENRVVFRAANIIRSDTGGVWIDGLPDQAAIIVVGQGFVNVGEESAPTLVEFDPTVAVGL